MSRPEYIPTDEQRNMVRVLTAAGYSELNISRAIGVSTPTLRKYFREELDIGHAITNSMSTMALWDLILKGNTTAILFWHKCRLGWREGDPTSAIRHQPGAMEHETTSASPSPEQQEAEPNKWEKLLN
jgi:hypothetical protein